MCSSRFPSGAGIPRQEYPATRPGSSSPLLGGFGWACCHTIRVHIVNDVTVGAKRHTFAYVPWGRTLREPGGNESAKGQRWGVLKRTLHSAFRDAIDASHSGHKLDERIGGCALAFFRVLFYA